jgi:hypothetical protein
MTILGFLFGLQLVHVIEHELKIVLRYSTFIDILTVLLMIFLGWALAVTGGLDEKHWMLSLLYLFCMCISAALTIKILLKKKGISFSGKRIGLL